MTGALAGLAALYAALADAAEHNSPGTKAALTLVKGTSAFEFETAEMKGTIQPQGAYHGVTRLVDKRTGRQLIDSRYSALNLFKLHSVNHYMGQPREMARTVTASPSSVLIKWAATEMHQGEITARYEVIEPNAIDVTITVRSLGTYPGYEVFMSSYFDGGVEPHVYLKPRPPASEPQLVLPNLSEAYRGMLLVFPRDALAARLCLDGRWDRSEGKVPTVPNCPVRPYAYCMAFFRDPQTRLGVVLMSQPRHAYAFSTRYFANKPADRLTTYSAADFSLFGNDLLPGDLHSVKVRLALTPLDERLSQPLVLYRAFLAEAMP
jgi:hypothetical protein